MSLTIDAAIEKLEGKMEKFKNDTTAEAKKETEVLSGQLKELRETQVKELTDKLTGQGATVEQLRNEVKELKASRGRIGMVGHTNTLGSVQKDIANMLSENKEVGEALTKSIPNGARFNPVVNIKAAGPVLTTNLASGNYIDYQDWRPGMEPTGQFRFRELVRSVASQFDNVQYPVANTPIGEGSFARQTTEGAVKAQVDRDYTMKPLQLTPLAGWITVSRQALRNIPFLQTWLPTSLNEQLLDQEDVDFSTSLLAAADGVATVPGNVTVAIEQLIMLIKNAKKAKYNPNGIAVDPDIWAYILITKPQNYSLPNAVVITPDGRVSILGVPVYPVNWLTGGNVIVGDWTKAAIVESEGLNFRQSDNVGTQFVQNEITFLLERTNGLMINRTDAFIKKVITVS